jgi:hypothetical protein
MKNSDTCHLSWTPNGALLTSKTKSPIRINEIINTLKTMDYHFGKKKFRSGNIPFTMFGPFDQKSNVLFHDKTDLLKTKYELTKVMNFPRSLESHIEHLLNTRQQCTHSSSSSIHMSIVCSIAVLLLRIF